MPLMPYVPSSHASCRNLLLQRLEQVLGVSPTRLRRQHRRLVAIGVRCRRGAVLDERLRHVFILAEGRQVQHGAAALVGVINQPLALGRADALQQRRNGVLGLVGHSAVQRRAASRVLDEGVRTVLDEELHEVGVVELGREHQRSLALFVLPVQVDELGVALHEHRPEQLLLAAARELVQRHLALFILNPDAQILADELVDGPRVAELARNQQPHMRIETLPADRRRHLVGRHAGSLALRLAQNRDWPPHAVEPARRAPCWRRRGRRFGGLLLHLVCPPRLNQRILKLEHLPNLLITHAVSAESAHVEAVVGRQLLEVQLTVAVRVHRGPKPLKLRRLHLWADQQVGHPELILCDDAVAVLVEVGKDLAKVLLGDVSRRSRHADDTLWRGHSVAVTSCL
mmetsp:Transcript_21874/g.64867  ORF Transcript_21874/g.64867 Transcript_21874/m.64867 type:complete len:399 (+) Transcript_21874:142-1338(+)